MRSAQDAVKAAKAHAETGHTYVVDMDIKKFFDRVNHDILMSKIGKVVRDKRVLQIVGRFLRAGVVMPDGLAVSSEEGTPQGGPLCFAALTPAGLPIGRLSRCARFRLQELLYGDLHDAPYEVIVLANYCFEFTHALLILFMGHGCFLVWLACLLPSLP